MKYWYIVYTRSRAEKKIALQLENESISYFLPLHKELRQWSDRKKWVEEPLFPSYIFVHVHKKDILLVLGIFGVLYHLTINGTAVTLTDKRMLEIKRAVECKDLLEVVSGSLLPGEMITLKNGPLKGMKGIVVHKEGQHHILVAIEELGKYLKIKIRPEEL